MPFDDLSELTPFERSLIEFTAEQTGMTPAAFLASVRDFMIARENGLVMNSDADEPFTLDFP